MPPFSLLLYAAETKSGHEGRTDGQARWPGAVLADLRPNCVVAYARGGDLAPVARALQSARKRPSRAIALCGGSMLRALESGAWACLRLGGWGTEATFSSA